MDKNTHQWSAARRACSFVLDVVDRASKDSGYSLALLQSSDLMKPLRMSGKTFRRRAVFLSGLRLKKDAVSWRALSV